VKIVAIIVAVILVVGLVMLIQALRKSASGANAVVRNSAEPSRTLEEKLSVLRDCGFELAPPLKIDDLLEMMDREEYEEPGWNMVLIGLGSEEEKEPFRPHCTNLWYLDTECIEDHGDYKRIAERMAEMAQGSLPLKDIKDYVDIEEEKAWVSFNLKGEEVRIDCKVQDDWLDRDIFPKFAALLKKSDPSKVFIYYNMGGQDCLIGCVDEAQLKQLNERGIGFKRL
jgi:hypothetical protein